MPNCQLYEFDWVWGGPVGAGANCVFPFRILGRKINACTTLTEGDKRPWCPTNTDSNGEYRLGKREWGYCDPKCSFVNDEGRLIPGTTPPPSLRKIRPTFTTISVPTRPLARLTTTSTTTPLPPANPWELNPESRRGTWLPDHKKGECGFYTNVGFIVGGEQALRGEFPFAVLLGYNEPGYDNLHYKCGGALINRRYVLTAAHCHFEGTSLEIAEVLIGEYDVGLDPDCLGCRSVARYKPEAVIVHERYADLRHVNGEHDIALIRLPEPITTIYEDPDSIVAPVCLGFGEDLESLNEFYTMGWGRTSNGLIRDTDIPELGVSQRTLFKLRLPLVEFPQCKARFSNITPNFICAGGEDGKDSCNGDSGGPLIARDDQERPMFLMGIISRGTRRCGIGAPGLYVKLNNYEEWILSKLRP
ncbi:hypothetical protein TCAL_05924 [Tigriopus californicus]|uniref:Peptidase S1 domain-containing protein n=1 Tax=Tigriopus californicus TaxID=6832 RepID=A0A553NZB9_TIGCA|nr:hypothetical protein TCAL_05924 [Tigriopus californicus]